MNIRKSAAMTCLAMAIVAMVGCSAAPTATNQPSADDSPLVAAAKAEGTVTWYATSAPDLMRDVGDAFTAKYGIKVEIFRAPSSQLILRYESERDAGGTVADVMTHSVLAQIEKPKTEGEFIDLTKQKDAALANLNALPTDSFGSDAAVLLRKTPTVIAYNTDLVDAAEVPKSWKEFVAFAKDGRATVPDWESSQTFVDFLEMLKTEYGEGILGDMAKLKTTTYPSLVPAMQALAAGEHTIGIAHPTQILPLKEQGAPIDFMLPEVTTGPVTYGAVPSSAPHSNAGLLFLDFLLTQENGQVSYPLDGVKAAYDPNKRILLPETAAAEKDKSELLSMVRGK